MAESERPAIPSELLRDNSPSKAHQSAPVEVVDNGPPGKEQRIHYTWKILCVGDMGVGKTAFLKRAVDGIFNDAYKSTIGVDFLEKRYLFTSTGRSVSCQLWDIAGQERFGTMTRVYYKEAVGALVVCDNRVVSYESIKRWKNDIDEKVRLPNGDSPIPCLLLINKSDLEAELSFPDDEHVKAYAEEAGFFGYCHVSAKTGDGCEQALDKMIHHLMDSGIDHVDSDDDDIVNLTTPRVQRRQCKC